MQRTKLLWGRNDFILIQNFFLIFLFPCLFPKLNILDRRDATLNLLLESIIPGTSKEFSAAP